MRTERLERIDRIGAAFGTHCLCLVGGLAALLVASEVGASLQFSSQRFPVGRTPIPVAVTDLDGDAVLDLVTANWGGDDVSVLLGNGDGTFQPATSFAVGELPRSMATADLNGDTAPDLVTANVGSDSVSVLLGNGDGTFQPAASFAAGGAPGSVVVADLDGDTRLDLVTANRRTNGVSVLLGNGDGTFRAGLPFAAGSLPVSLAVADLDGDTVLDLVTANAHSRDVSILLGNGNGTFQVPVSFAVGNSPDSPNFVVVADLDGDTVPDLVTANWFRDDISVLLGNGDGTFRAERFFAVGHLPASVAVADLDGDTVPDLVTANHDRTDDVSVLLGNGDGTFQAAVFFTSGFFPSSVAVADLDGDTVPDLVTTNSVFAGEVSVLLNRSMVRDTTPPDITCPDAAVVECSVIGGTPSGASQLASFFAGASAEDDHDPTPTITNDAPTVFPVGATTPVSFMAMDEAGNTAICTASVTVEDTIPPEVICAVETEIMWPPRHQLMSVAYAATAEDVCYGLLPVSTAVSGDEKVLGAGGDGHFSPDATLDPDLRLRAERAATQDGRVYLILSSAIDGAGNEGWACCTVTVTHDQSPASVADVASQAAAAEVICEATGDAPPGFIALGQNLASGSSECASPHGASCGFPDADCDGVDDAIDNCPFWPNSDQIDRDENGRGNLCECGDQNEDGLVNVADILEMNAAIMSLSRASTRCDANHDGKCNVADILAVSRDLFSRGSASTCHRHPIPGP